VKDMVTGEQRSLLRGDAASGVLRLLSRTSHQED
jgi:hypothetical protein